jgi:hypothetical protein
VLRRCLYPRFLIAGLSLRITATDSPVADMFPSLLLQVSERFEKDVCSTIEASTASGLLPIALKTRAGNNRAVDAMTQCALVMRKNESSCQALKFKNDAVQTSDKASQKWDKQVRCDDT